MRSIIIVLFSDLLLHLQMAPLGYGLLHRVRSLERDLRSSQEGKERLQAEMKTLAEELQRRGETLERRDSELETARRLQHNAEKQKELTEQAMSTVIAGHRTEKEALEIRLRSAKEDAVGEFKASASFAELQKAAKDAAVEEFKTSATFAELLRAAKAAAVAEYKFSEDFSAHMVEASSDSFAQGFDACVHQVKVISPDFPTSRLTVYEDEPLAAETVLPESNAPSAAAAPVVEGTRAEVVPRQEVPLSAAVALIVERTLEAPASESEVEAEDFALQRSSSAARTETTAGAASGEEVTVVASAEAVAEASDGSPEMRVLT